MTGERGAAARRPKIAVVIPAYNHADYIGEAIASVLAQDWPELELHVLDDGSSDGTFDAAAQALEVPGGQRVVRRLARQANAGSATTLNRLIAGVDADLVAILNSDDAWRPGRLAAMAASSAPGPVLAFSGVAFDADSEVAPGQSFEDWYRGKLAYALSLPSCGFALVAANLAISSSNFLFSRDLFDRVGGFDPALPLTQDWAFLLKALRWAEPRLVPGRLLYYRSHATNSFRRLNDVRIDQSRAALDAFIAWAAAPAENPLAPTPGAWPRFFPVFARSCAPAFSSEPVGCFLPPALMDPPVDLPARPGEDRALANIVLASRARQANLALPTEELLARAATLWSAVAAGRAGSGPDG